MHENIFNVKKVNLPKETIYEGSADKRIGIALAKIRESEPHYHTKITEWYLVVRGNGVATVGGRKIKLKPYDILTIKPGAVHNVKSNANFEVWVLSIPPWKKSDHYLVKARCKSFN